MKITLSREGSFPVKGGGVGLFLEDLNYALDGGLYAEALENRNFEAKRARGKFDCYTVEDDGGYAWAPVGEDVTLKVKTDRPLYPESPHYMRVIAKHPDSGMKNQAYDGVYLKAKAEYACSFYARSYDYKGKLTVGVFADGVSVLCKKFKMKADGQWHRYSFRAKSKLATDGAEFRVLLSEAGALHLDAFSLMPSNAVLGVFRRDLVELLKEVKPEFLRFPGGCVVEGNGLSNRYVWKNTLAQPERRKHNWNRWAVHGATEESGWETAFSHYGQSMGIGYYEYFRLAEYLGAKALPVVNLGMACQYMSSECVPYGSEELELYIQEALDVVEFANGDAGTVWGRVRAEMGHPEPFGLEYLALGNEQWQTDGEKGKTGNDFEKRFELFERRIHDRYPALKIVGTVGPTVDSETHKRAWKWTREKLEENENFVYCSDEHFYMSPEWMYAHTGMYDDYPRNGLVCAGEYAAHVKKSGAGEFNAPQSSNWEAALAEAAFMTGMERNADVVVMKSYAPLFARIGYTQWSPSLIWFDGKHAYGTPSYYVQKLFGTYTGEHALSVRTDEKNVFVSATENDGFTFVKLANAGNETLEVSVEADFEFGSLIRIISMSGELSDYNTLMEPEKVAPVDIAPAQEHAFSVAPRSFLVLLFKK